MRKQLLLALTLVLVVAFHVSAAKGPVTYVVHGQDKIESYRKIFDKFTEETGIEVEIIVARNSTNLKWEMVTTFIAGGVSPDIVSGVSTEFGAYAMAGFLQPLDPFIERDGMDRSALVGSFLKALQMNGNQYILPYGSSALTMIYNKNVFAEAGVAPPPRDWESTWTWEEFVEAAARMTRRDAEGNVLQWGVSNYDTNQWVSLPHQFGGRWVSEDLTEFLGTSNETIAALEALQDLMYQYEALNPRGHQDDFLTGVHGINATGTWFLPQLSRTDIDWDFMPWFRYGNNEPRAAIFPVGYGILTTAPHPEEAWELIKWLTWNEDANLEYAIAAGAIPSLLTNMYPWALSQMEMLGRDVTIDIIGAQMERYNAIIDVRKSPAFSTFDPVMREAVNSVWRNEKAPRTAMEEVKTRMDQWLREAMQQ